MSNITVNDTAINLVAGANNTLMIDSRDIAKVYNKRHGDVLRVIDNHIETLKRIREYESLNNENALLRSRSYTVITGNGTPKDKKYYLLNRDMFNIVVLKFRGDKAMKFTVQFIKAFNAMEKKLLENDAQLTDEQKELAKYSSIRGLQPKAENFGELSTTGNGCSRVNYVRAYVRSSKKDPISVLMGLKRQWEDRKVEAGLFGEWSANEIADTIKAIDTELNKLMTKSIKEGLERKANHKSIEYKS